MYVSFQHPPVIVRAAAISLGSFHQFEQQSNLTAGKPLRGGNSPTALWGPGPVGAGVLSQLTKSEPHPHPRGSVRSSQEAESIPKACPSARDTPLTVLQPWVVQTAGEVSLHVGRSPETLWFGTSNWRWPQGMDCRDPKSSTTPTLWVKGRAGAHEDGPRVKALGPLATERAALQGFKLQ